MLEIITSVRTNLPDYLIRVIFLCLVLPFDAGGQAGFRSIDRHARTAPVELHQNLPELTDYLVQPARDEVEKVRAIYVWITHNIRYDDEAYRNDVKRINRNNADILRRQRAVCFGYALLFQAMGNHAGLATEVVSGYSKGTLTSRPDLEEADHAWNAVRIDGRWRLLDATWGSSLIDQENEFVQEKEDTYFLSPPDQFVWTHLPNLPMWQLLDCPVPPATFQEPADSIRQYLDATPPCFSYPDTIGYYMSLESSQRRLWEAEATYRFNPTTANRKNLGHSLFDYAGFRSDIADGLQSRPALIDSLIQVQEEVISLCERAFLLTTSYEWQKELYVNTLLNQTVALYLHAEKVEDTVNFYEEALKCLEKGEAMLESLSEDSYFGKYARQQCRRMRPVIEAALK